MEGPPPEGGQLARHRLAGELVPERHHAAREPEDAALQRLVDRREVRPEEGVEQDELGARPGECGEVDGPPRRGRQAGDPGEDGVPDVGRHMGTVLGEDLRDEERVASADPVQALDVGVRAPPGLVPPGEGPDAGA